MAVLTRDQILGCNDRPVSAVDVPGLGTVHIRP